MKDQIILEIEAFWTGRMCTLVTEDRIDDSDALYLEFVVDGEEPEEWFYLEDLTNVY